MNKEFQDVLTKGLKLYYRILKLHKNTLLGKLKRLGDLYVKQ
jgi:hypothetical protein